MKLLITFAVLFLVALGVDAAVAVAGRSAVSAGHGSDPAPAWQVWTLWGSIATLVLSAAGFGFVAWRETK